MSLDCSGGIRAFRQALDSVIGFERDIGYPLADQSNLDALADGWNLFPTHPRRLVLALVDCDRIWLEDERWTKGFLSIASQASRRHLVGGCLFFTALVVPEDAVMIGSDLYSVSLPGPLHRIQLEKDPV